MRIFGKGFNFSQDGPGNRLVYHLSGCNMRCPWCSNPEGMDRNAGKEYTVEEILAECISVKPMLFSGGGITFTGGEATLQEDELIRLLSLLQDNGINTAIETNATSERLLTVAESVDYLIMDFKHYDAEVLKSFTGVDNRRIKLNLEAICKSGRQVHIRIPLINGFNADDPTAFAEYFSGLDTSNAVFELLPYHEYGKGKWRTEYKIKDGFVSEDTVKEFYEIFTAHGLTVINT